MSIFSFLYLNKKERARIAENHSVYVLFQHNVPMLRHEEHADLRRPVRPDTAKEEGKCRKRLSAKHTKHIRIILMLEFSEI